MKNHMLGLLVYLALCLSIGVISFINVEDRTHHSWSQWKISFARIYGSREQELYRKSIFEENLQTILLHQKNNYSKYMLGLNQFADLTQEEFASLYLYDTNQEPEYITEIVMTVNEEDVDWTTKGVVGPVRNSGSMCAGSHAWATIGAIQGCNAIKTGNLTLYSWQQIIDCSKEFGNQGCQGTVQNSLAYIKEKGILTEKQYPITGNVGTCHQKPGGLKINSFTLINSCTSLSQALLLNPVSVYVDASKFMFYQSGIFDNCAQNLNLAVVLVGMSSQYWKLKLNWGTSWGQKGFIRIAQGNTCGICLKAANPTL